MALPLRQTAPTAYLPSKRLVFARPTPISERFMRFLLGLAWAVLVGTLLLLVNTQINVTREQTASLDLKTEQKRVLLANEELQAKMASDVSVAEIIAWATNHRMVRVTTAEPLNGNPKAVAP